METDADIFEIFESNPARFAELTARQMPTFRSATSPTLKKSLDFKTLEELRDWLKQA